VSSATGRPVEGPFAGSSVPAASSSGPPLLARRPLPARPPISWLAWAGIVAALVALLPPVGTWARRWVVGEAIQFSLLAYVVPPLIVLGLAPATRRRLAAWPRLPRRAGPPASGAGRLAEGTPRAERYRFDPLQDRPGRGAFDPAAARAWIALVVFVGVVALWRSAAVIDALARREPLILLEAATLVAPGCALWLNLVDSGPSLAGAGRPRRMTMAALAMWSIWVLAFILGFSGHPMFSAYHHRAGSGLSALSDQELAVAVLWAIPTLAMMPVVFGNLVKWLRS